MSDLPYSYHTFLFPFIWNDGGKVTWDGFQKVLAIGRHWFETDWKEEAIPAGIGRDDWLQDYAAFRYFTDAANRVIFCTCGGNAAHCFEYRYNGQPLRNIGTYIITKGSEVFRLNINAIRLNVYDTGVAILVFELENRECRSLVEVNKINEYGRRINLPYLTPGSSHNLCADKIAIDVSGEVFTEDYLQKLNELGEDFDAAKKTISLSYIMKPIQHIIDSDSGYEVTSTRAHRGAKKLFIKPCVDDRMFVCCLVLDEAFADEIKGEKDQGEYAYLSSGDKSEGRNSNSNNDIINPTISTDLYQFAYIETSPSCRSRKMRRKLLEECVYDRWIDDGTIYAATHHSLVCATKCEDPNPVINPFLTLYVQLAKLALVQRATILALSDEAAGVAEGLNTDRDITSEQIEAIEKLQARYVKAQNQLMLFEATVQEQGVEVYNLIKEQLYIKKNLSEFDRQMNNLRDVANISHDRLERKIDDERQKSEKKISNLLNVIAIIGFLLALIQVLFLCFDQ